MKKGCIIFASVLFVMSCSSPSTEKSDAGKNAGDTAVTVAPPPAAKDTAAERGLSLIGQSDCLTCHKLHEASTGPAYQDVAAKYQGQQNMIDSLANKVIKGGSGTWGSIPMAGHPALSKEDAVAMVHYVLSVKKQ